MSSTKEMITLDQVAKNYGEKIALSPLSLCIKQNEVVALIGPSGAGKTTLLNMQANVITPDEGSINIDGKHSFSYESDKQLSRKIGILRQQFDLDGPLPVI